MRFHVEHHFSAPASAVVAVLVDRAPDRLNGSAHFSVVSATTESEEPASVRRLDGDLRVAIRPIGGMAERRIVPGLLRRLDIEAQAVDQRLGTG